MKAITEDWTEEEQEAIAFMLKLRELKGGVGIPASSEKKQGGPCRKSVEETLQAFRNCTECGYDVG
jgi:hypothetical protein